MVKELAKLFIGRADQLGYKGKTRDKMALEFMTGAAAALSLLQPPQDISKIVWLVSIRGYSTIHDLSVVENKIEELTTKNESLDDARERADFQRKVNG